MEKKNSAFPNNIQSTSHLAHLSSVLMPTKYIFVIQYFVIKVTSHYYNISATQPKVRKLCQEVLWEEKAANAKNMCTLSCQFLWIGHSWFPLRFSLASIKDVFYLILFLYLRGYHTLQLNVLIIWCLYADFKHLGDQNHREKSWYLASELIILSLLVGIC